MTAANAGVVLLPLSLDGCQHQGVIHHQKADFRFRLNINPRSGQMSLDLSPELHRLLQGSEKLLQQRLQQCTTPFDFAIELKDVVTRLAHGEQVAGTSDSTSVAPVEFFQTVLKQLETVGWKHVVNIDTSFTEIQLQLWDGRGSVHSFELKLAYDFPISRPICKARLPASHELRWTPRVSSLSSAKEQIQQWVSLYQDFWEVMDDLDANCWVLEPTAPTPSDTTRRLALGPHCSLQITVNPLQPRAVPDCRFMGSDVAVAPLKFAFNRNITTWDKSAFLRENIQRMLEIPLPAQISTSAGSESLRQECGICYTFLFNDHAPSKLCDNKKCAQPFHTECLAEWLRAIPSTRQSFNTLFGQCPYCSENMTLTLTSLR